MGLSSEEGNFADINIMDSVVSLVVEILLFLVLLEALFGRQFSWWKVTFFLSSFLLVLLVDCYVVHCPSFASFA